ncbi:MAG: hypothetical protein GEU74_02180 [Nitriliruptorales bacterium]|nr:hypothetical protein [Nitriliruptorales bacterium]
MPARPGVCPCVSGRAAPRRRPAAEILRLLAAGESATRGSPRQGWSVSRQPNGGILAHSAVPEHAWPRPLGQIGKPGIVKTPPVENTGEMLPTHRTAVVRNDGRPLLRGWLHAAMAPMTIAGTFVLWNAAGPSPLKRASVAVFGACMTGLYTTSSLYHLAPWTERGRYIMSRCDVAMIQLFIAATFTPVALHALSGPWRVWSLIVAWAIALTGAVVSASPVNAPRWLATAGYIGMGWLSVIPLTRVITALPWEGTGLIVLGGILYTVGAIVYARRRPDPLPTWFGYHEIFHLFVVAASICHYLAIWRYVLPLAT